MKRSLLLLAALPVWPATIRAQLANVRLGSRVRIEACEVPHAPRRSRVRTYVGDIERNDSSTIVVRSPSNNVDTLTASQILNAYWSVGWRSPARSTVKGMLLGIALGGLLGVGVAVLDENTSAEGSESWGWRAPAVFFGFIGGVVGTLLGSASGGDQWRRTAFPINSGTAC